MNKIRILLLIAFISIGLKAHSVPIVRIYTAIISQSYTSNPVVHVLRNDFDAPIIWTRVSTGYYVGKLPGEFIPFRTWAVLESDNMSAIIYGSIDQIVIVTRNSSNLPSDNIMNQSSVEIRVYL